ncbi:MAG: TIGR02680 family protein, partial [Planctomycetota bacterium]
MTVATRWQPTRCGLLNLYRYDDEVFRFAGGRLLLRGNNGCGKTRVLALTLPFLFDGVISPARVEPDGDRSRRFEWHLLMDRYHERTGYTWLEFARTDESGATCICTIGCGLRALAGHQGLRAKWYFVTPQRVGPDFPLKREDGTPWNRDQCKQALDGQGMLYDTAEAYRHAVDEALFGLGTHRYRSLVDLLIELRRPQLSRTLDELRLTAALSDALPPIDPGVIAEVAENFQALEADREELRAACEAHEAVTVFQRVYRDYLAVRARLLADRVRREHTSYDDAQRRLGAAVERIDAARSCLVAIAEAQTRVAEARQTARGEEEALRASDTMRSAESLARLRDECERVIARAEADRVAWEQAVAEVSAWEERRDESAATLAQAERMAAEAGARVRADGAPLGCEPGAGEPDAAGWERLQVDAESLRGAVRLLRADARRLAAAREREQLAAEQRADAEAARDAAQAGAEAADDAFACACAAHRDGVNAHLAENPGFALDAQRLQDDLAAWLRDPREADPVAAAFEHAARLVFQELAAEEVRRALDREAIERERAELEAEAEALRAGVDPAPALAPWRRAREDGRAGAPLWACCDFVDDLSADERACLEAALEGAQLLDAWITPEGALHDPATGDVLLGASEQPAQSEEPHLGMWLQPSSDADIDAAVIARALVGVGGAPDTAPLWVDTTGRWAAGELRGRAAKPAAAHIGAATRAAERERRLCAIATRLLQLANAEADIDDA